MEFDSFTIEIMLVLKCQNEMFLKSWPVFVLQISLRKKKGAKNSIKNYHVLHGEKKRKEKKERKKAIMSFFNTFDLS